MIFSKIFLMIFYICRLNGEKRRHHGLKFCEKNPILKNLNRTAIIELEKELFEWDRKTLARMNEIARSLGNGVHAYLADTSTPFFSKNDPCDTNGINGIESGVELIFPVKKTLPCRSLKKFGRENTIGDTGKFLCNADVIFQQPDCIIYSLGSNNQFDFEEAILREFPKCKVYTFDCTSKPPPDTENYKNVIFNKWCLGPKDFIAEGGREYRTLESIMQTLNHPSIQLLKMDIEGWEMDVFEAMLKFPYNSNLPYQISFETHHWHFWSPLALQHLALSQALKNAGYRFVSFENNVHCKSCNEFTVVRVYC